MVTGEYALRCRGITKTYGQTRAVEDLEIDLAPGHVLGLLGPSGCGKTTALRIIAGLEAPDSGTIEITGRTVVGPGINVAPERRRVGMVFQDYALFPHMSVADNVAFGLPKGMDRKWRVPELLDLVGLAGLERRLPHELSGGQQQRVAMARALAAEPQLLLLDEPFSNLDPLVRRRVRAEVKELLQAVNATAIFVTHDQEEALSLAEHVAVMFDGRIHQLGTPLEVYTRPADPTVAEFIGEPNFLPAQVHGGVVECELGMLPSETAITGTAQVMVRAEDLEFGPAGMPAEVVASEYYGHDQLVTVRLGSGQLIKVRQKTGVPIRPGDHRKVRVTGDVLVFRA
jgi:iron(III) transport system ATP-binding protein